MHYSHVLSNGRISHALSFSLFAGSQTRGCPRAVVGYAPEQICPRCCWLDQFYMWCRCIHHKIPITNRIFIEVSHQSSGDANSNTASTRLKAHSRFEESLLATLVYFHQLQKSLGGIRGVKKMLQKKHPPNQRIFGILSLWPGIFFYLKSTSRVNRLGE